MSDILSSSLNLCDCYSYISGLPDNSIDLIVTDPPYEFSEKSARNGIDNGAISGSYNHVRTRMYSHMSRISESFGMSFSPLVFLNLCKRIMKKFNAYFFSSRLSLSAYLKFAEENNYLFDILVWSKPNPIPNYNGHYLSDIEYVIYIRERGSYFNSSLDYSMYFKNFNYPKGKKESAHPTEKPLELMDRFILISSRGGDVVFDPFMGSGTTMLSAKNNGRNYIGCEIFPDYYAIAASRLGVKESGCSCGGSCGDVCGGEGCSCKKSFDIPVVSNPDNRYKDDSNLFGI